MTCDIELLDPQILPEARLEREIGLTSLAEFLRLAWHVVEPATPLVWGRHLDAICEHLEAISNGQILNLVIAVPPGCTKSITTSVIWPVWSWIRNPSLRFLCASNENDLVIRDAVAARRLIESPWFRWRWGDLFKLTSDQNVKSWYENNHRGYRTSTTVASKTTGKKGDILLVDDPHDARSVESEVERKAVLEWWDQVFYNRVNDAKTGRRVIIGQRTHHGDLQGHVLGQGFEELRIPEEFERSNRCQTSIGWSDWREKDGDLLRVDRFGPVEVAAAKERLGTMGYAAQHQQRPVPKEGAIFKKDWLRYYACPKGGSGTRLTDGDKPESGPTVIWQECRRFGTVDLAASTKTSADYTVIACWADDKKGNLYLLDLHRSRMEGPDIVPKMKELREKHKLDWLAVESTGFQLALIQEAERKGLPIRSIRPDKDKVSRAMAATVRFEAGKVWLCKGAIWLADLETELLLFPHAEHDDIVDAVVYGILEFGKLYESAGRPTLAVPGYGNRPEQQRPGRMPTQRRYY